MITTPYTLKFNIIPKIYKTKSIQNGLTMFGHAKTHPN